MTTDPCFALAAANRRLAADMFEGLTPEQWTTPSLCAGWTVREVAAHLVSAVESGLGTAALLGQIVRFRGNLNRMVDTHARETARRPTTDLVQSLRRHAEVQMAPPVIGAAGPMTDTFIHLRDAARPLGLAVSPDAETWRPALDFLVSKPARRGFVPRTRLAGLALVATDLDWSFGAGPTLRGPAEALAMAVTGRGVALADLTGDGVQRLTERLTRP